MNSDNHNETLHPVLEHLKSREPYKIPEGFFDALQADVLQQVNLLETHRRQKLSFARRLRVALCGIASAAAAVLLLFNVAPGVWSTHSASISRSELAVNEAFDGLSDTDQQYLIDDYQADMAMYYANL